MSEVRDFRKNSFDRKIDVKFRSCDKSAAASRKFPRSDSVVGEKIGTRSSSYFSFPESESQLVEVIELLVDRLVIRVHIPRQLFSVSSST
jgi:predicted metal-dependent RNase